MTPSVVPRGHVEGDAGQRRSGRALVPEGDIRELDVANERRAHAVVGTPALCRLVDQVGDGRNGDARLVVLVDELRQLQQRTGDALRQHQEGKQGAEIDGIAAGKREIDADGERAGHGEPLERPAPPTE